MNISADLVPASRISNRGVGLAAPPALRLALVADLAREGWTSMDLVADTLMSQLQSAGSISGVEAELMRPMLADRGRRIGRFVNRYFDYPRWLRQHARGFDVYHVVDHSYAHVVHVLPASRTVVTCHDADAFLGLVAPHLTRSKLPKALVRRVLSGMQQAAVVACDSAATRDELLAFDLIRPEQAVVVHNGVVQAFTDVPSEASDASIAPYIDESPEAIYLLHVGTCIPRKRIDRLLAVFAAVRSRDSRVRLLKVGGRLTDEQNASAERLGVRDHIVTLPFLEPAQLAAVYRRAAAVIVTSDREGFALPIVEAMACGTSVIATDLPVFREVGGSAIRLAPPEDVQLWRDIVLETVASHVDADARSRTALRNRQQAARFSWSTHAQQMTDIYRRLS